MVAAVTPVSKDRLGLSAPVLQDFSSLMTLKLVRISTSVSYLVSAASSATMKEEPSGATVQMVTSLSLMDAPVKLQVRNILHKTVIKHCRC